jgi:mono/diheme cytochrome c family protein
MKKTITISAVAVFLFAVSLFALPSSNANGVNGEKSAGKSVTFTKEVAPIFYKSCAECHRPGEVAPFSVLSYKDVRPWAKSIREKVVSKEMPPWHADPNHGQWLNDRRLTQQQIETITAWVDGGAVEGNPKDLPAAPKFVDGWTIGKPDETFSIPEQSVPANGVIKYQYFDVATNFKEDHWVKAAEIRSSGRAAVHHVIVFVTEPNSSSRGGDGNLLVGFAPGEQPARYQAGLAKKVPAGAKLRFQMHYTPNGEATKDITTVGLIYAKEPPKHQALTRPVLNTGFVIPAGASSHEVKSSYLFREDTRIISFMPHMHLRGKDFEFKAVYPDGRSEILLSVPKYDFSWQTYYTPKEPVMIPKGTKIECTAHFDNSTNNKFNPDPTKDVRWGDQTWEEMMIGWLTYYNDDTAAKPAAASSSSGGQK